MKKTVNFTLDTRSAVVVWANWFQFASDQRILNPKVLDRTLIWCREGRGKMRVNGKWHRLEPDDFLFLPWGHEVLYSADTVNPFLVGGIHIVPFYSRSRPLVFGASYETGQKIPSWQKDLPWVGLEEVSHGVARPSDPLRQLATYMVDRFQDGFPEMALRELTGLLVSEIRRAVTAGALSKARSHSVLRVQEFIEGHLSRAISIRELTRLIDFSPSTLRREFHRAVAMSPYQWALRARMRRASQLLAMTTLRIKEIAAQVGFADAFQFSRTFKRWIGISPKEFRRRNSFFVK